MSHRSSCAFICQRSPPRPRDGDLDMRRRRGGDLLRLGMSRAYLLLRTSQLSRERISSRCPSFSITCRTRGGEERGRLGLGTGVRRWSATGWAVRSNDKAAHQKGSSAVGAACALYAAKAHARSACYQATSHPETACDEFQLPCPHCSHCKSLHPPGRAAQRCILSGLRSRACPSAS